MTGYEAHRRKWSNCKRCALSAFRSRIVLSRGSKLPAPILFIGEAPGPSEDALGLPFIGPAGKLLDRIIEVAIDGRFDYAMTNVVACIPRESTGEKFKEPPPEAVKACEPRLVEFVQLCKPRLIVLLGKIPKKYIYGEAQLGKSGKRADWLPKTEHLRFLELIHPSAIKRMDVSQQGLAIQRCVVALEDAIAELEDA